MLITVTRDKQEADSLVRIQVYMQDLKSTTGIGRVGAQGRAWHLEVYGE